MRLTATLVLIALSGPAAADPTTGLGAYGLCQYQRELVAYCGLLDGLAAQGATLACRTARAALDEAEAGAESRAAGIAFDREWQNRNKGGRRLWCLVEGKAATLGFVARAIETRFAEPPGVAKQNREPPGDPPVPPG
jgi:hypothetical protein